MDEPQKMGAAFSEIDFVRSVLMMHPYMPIHKSMISYVVRPKILCTALVLAQQRLALQIE